MNKTPLQQKNKPKFIEKEFSPLNDPIFKIQIKPSKRRTALLKGKRSPSNLSKTDKKRPQSSFNKTPKVSNRRSEQPYYYVPSTGYRQSTVCTPKVESSYTSIFYSKKSKKIEKKTEPYQRRSSPRVKSRFEALRISLSKEKYSKSFLGRKSIAQSLKAVNITNHLKMKKRAEKSFEKKNDRGLLP